MNGSRFGALAVNDDHEPSVNESHVEEDTLNEPGRGRDVVAREKRQPNRK